MSNDTGEGSQSGFRKQVIRNKIVIATTSYMESFSGYVENAFRIFPLSPAMLDSCKSVVEKTLTMFNNFEKTLEEIKEDGLTDDEPFSSEEAFLADINKNLAHCKEQKQLVLNFAQFLSDQPTNFSDESPLGN